MKSQNDGKVDQVAESMTPFQLLSHYAETATSQGVLKKNNDISMPSYLMFTAEEEGFLISVESIASVIRERPVVKPLPFSPNWFEGLSSVRNEIVSVVSFSRLYKEKPKKRQTDRHYILLSGVMNGFLLEVDKLVGIKSLAIQDAPVENGFVDGYVTEGGVRWQRINLDVLLASKLNKKMEF